jgi:membrane protease YdiL (CAAX protease family)
MNLNKLARLVVMVLSVLAIVFLATIMTSDEKDGGMITPIIYVAYVMLCIAIVFVVFYMIKGLMAKKGDLKKTFISVGAFLGIFVIAFVFADGTPVPLKDGGEVSAFASKLVSTGLNAFYFLALIAIVLMFLTGYTRIKK